MKENLEPTEWFLGCAESASSEKLNWQLDCWQVVDMWSTEWRPLWIWLSLSTWILWIWPSPHFGRSYNQCVIHRANIDTVKALGLSQILYEINWELPPHTCQLHNRFMCVHAMAFINSSCGSKEMSQTLDSNHPPSFYEIPKQRFSKTNVAYRSCHAAQFIQWTARKARMLCCGTSVREQWEKGRWTGICY